MNRLTATRAILALAYLGCVLAANWLAAKFGVVPLAFGLTMVAGTPLAGCVLVIRNLGQTEMGRPRVLALMAAATGLSWFLAKPQLAVASAVAFGLSELTDMSLFTWLERRRYSTALIVAGVTGAVVDSWVFLHLAGYGVSAAVLGGQVLIKSLASVLVARDRVRLWMRARYA